MKERILEFLKKENKSSAQFAEEIGVQPSGISHIISGRNNPSLDFIIKMLGKYPHLSTDWLLFGKGSMYRENANPTLFDVIDKEVTKPDKNIAENGKDKSEYDVIDSLKDDSIEKSIASDQEKRSKAERIVYFFSDKHFIEYFPYNKK